MGKPTTCVMCVFFMSSEGKGNAEKVQERVARINQLRETLREETMKNGAAAEKSDLCHQVSQLLPFQTTQNTHASDWFFTRLCAYPVKHTDKIYVSDSRQPTLRRLFCHFNEQSQLEYTKALERRRQLKEDHGRLIQEEVDTMQRDLAEQQLSVR